MSTSKITVLKLRQLKQCDDTSRVVSRLPAGCTAGMLQFNVSIPTELWKIIVDRQTKAVADSARRYGSVTILPTRDIRDVSANRGVIGLLSRHIRSGLHVYNAAFVQPVSEEEFRSYGLTISHLTVSFGSDNFNIGVVLGGPTGSDVGSAIFAVSRFPDVLTERPSGALVSCTINV